MPTLFPRAPSRKSRTRAPARKSRTRASARHQLAVGLLAAMLAGAPDARAQDARPPKHDYPTSARADYVIGCLAANGFQHRFLDQCACSIDAIADQLSYDDYERAETILSMQQAAVGPRGGLFRDTPVAKESLQQIQRAQAEASLRCTGNQ